MSTQVSTAVSTYSAPESVVRRIYEQAAKLDRVGMGLLRLGLIIVLCWIGGLKFADYEADGIVPLVANSPLMSFFYHYPAPEYHQYMNKEGEVIPAHQRAGQMCINWKRAFEVKKEIRIGSVTLCEISTIAGLEQA